jgi:hypothetical protein
MLKFFESKKFHANTNLILDYMEMLGLLMTNFSFKCFAFEIMLVIVFSCHNRHIIQNKNL